MPTVIEAKSFNGIEGSTSINTIPDGKCLELENANIGQAGVIRKRDGYNLHACELPIKCFNFNTSLSLLFEYTPIINLTNLTTTIYKCENDILNQLVPSYSTTTPNDRNNVVILQVTNLPTGITFNENSILQVDTVDRAFSPIAVLDERTILISTVMLSFILSGADLTTFYTNYPNNTTAFSKQITAFDIVLCSGTTFDSQAGGAYFSSASKLSSTRVSVDYVTTPDISLGDVVLFESGFYESIAAPNYFSNNIAYVDNIYGNTVYFKFLFSLPTTPVFNIGNLKIRILRSQHIRLHTSPTTSYAFPLEVTTLSPGNNTDPKVSISNFYIQPRFVNRLYINSVGFASQINSPIYLYGTRKDVGYVAALNKYFNRQQNSEVMLTSVNGDLYEEASSTSPVYITQVPTIAASATIAVDPLTNLAIIPITGASNYYVAGDTIFRTQLSGTTLVTESYPITSVAANSVTVLATGVASISVLINKKWRIQRTSNRIYTLHNEIDTKKLVPGQTVQFDGIGSDYTYYTVTKVNVGVTAYDCWFEINDTITWTSDSSVYVGKYWKPVFYDFDGTNYSQKPITQSNYSGTPKDISTANYDYAMYLAAGIDGMWRYDGANLFNMRLPQPPLVYWRNIPNSVGFLPTLLGENGEAVGVPVNIRLTYIFTDSNNTTYESPICPDNDITITTLPVNDGSSNAFNIEVVVPSVPSGIGFPANKIRIRAYRTMTDRGGYELYRLDTEVDNDYSAPFTHLIVGNAATFFVDNYDLLYTEKDNLGSNMPAPMANYISVLDNKLVAIGKYDPPRFDIICNKTFELDTLDGSLFTSYSKLEFSTFAANNILKKYTFFTVPFAVSASGVEEYNQASVSNYPALLPNFQISKLASYGSDGSFTIDTASTKGIKYSDASNVFRLISSIGNLTCTENFVAKLRILGTLFATTPPINFNRDQFRANIDVATAFDEIVLTATTKWDATDATVLLANNAVKAAYFEQVATVAGDGNVFKKISPLGTFTDGTAPDGCLIISANTAAAQKAVRLRVNDTIIAPASLPNNALLVIQMNRKVNDIFVDDTLGNIQYGDGVNRSLNADIIWKIDSQAAVAGLVGPSGETFTDYVLNIVDLAIDFSTTTNRAWTATASVFHRSAEDTHGEFIICKLTANAVTNKPALRTDSFTPPSNSVNIFVTAAPPPYVAGTQIALEFNNNPDFLSLGYPNMKGVFTITAVDVGAQKITVQAVNTSQTIVASTITDGNPFAGTVFYITNFVTVDTVNHELKIKVSAAVGAVANDWHYLLFRGYEFNSVASQLSGWFKVKSVTNPSTIVYYFNTTNFDYSLFSGLSLARVIKSQQIAHSPEYIEYFVPVPVPYKRSLSEQLNDLAWPMFEQKSDTVYTPLMSVARRYAMAMTSVLRDEGFGYWGGGLDANTTVLYPANGFSFIAHKYPINRYKSIDSSNAVFLASNLNTTLYQYPFNTFSFYAANSNQYKIFGNIYNSTTAQYEIDTQDVTASTEYKFTYVSAYQGSKIMWTTPTLGTDKSKQMATFKYTNSEEINSYDGEDIIGAVPYQNYLVLAKNNSIFRTTLSKTGDKIDIERAQSTVGVLSGKNMVATESYCYFVHNTGVYYLEGLNVNPITTLNRYFSERVYQNIALMPFTAGYHNPIDKEVHIGTPYSSSESTTVDVVDGQFVYNYNENVNGWSVNRNIPATFWIRKLNEDYFASLYGKVFKMRTERNDKKFRDYEDPISFRLRTRYINMGDDVSFKFIRNFILQLGMSSDMNVTVNYTWDYFKDTKPLTIIPTTDARYTTSPYSAVTMVSNKYLKPVRGMVQPNRVAQLGLEIINAELDKKLEIFGVFIEGDLTNTKLVTQKNQQR